MKRDRRNYILSLLIDDMYYSVENWEDLAICRGLINQDERDYLMKTIKAFSKKVNVARYVDYDTRLDLIDKDE